MLKWRRRFFTPEDAGETAARERVPRLLTDLAVSVGIFFQLAQYLSCQPYWQDESSLLLNVIQKHTAALLFGPLDAVPSSQAAPPLFLLAIKAAVSCFGHSEFVTRAIPLLCGMASLPLFAAVCRCILQPAAVPWAVGLLACNDNLIFESATVKPYCGDVLAGLFLLYLVACPGDAAAPAVRLRRAALFTAVAIWFSYGAVFVFAAMSLALIPETARRNPIQYLRLNLIPAASFSCLWWFTIRVQRSPFLVRYWETRLADVRHPLSLPTWWLTEVRELFLYIERRPIGLALIPAAAAGLVYLKLRRPPRVFWSLLNPLLIATLAALFRQYPLGGGRVTIYLVPFEMIWVAAGIVFLADLLFTPWRPIWLAGSALILAACLAIDGYRLYQPRRNGDSRDLIAYLQAHRQIADPIYVAHDSTQDFLFAWPTAPDRIVLDFTPSMPVPEARFWVEQAYPPSEAARADYRAEVLRFQHARIRFEFHVRGGDAYLLEHAPAAPSRN